MGDSSHSSSDTKQPGNSVIENKNISTHHTPQQEICITRVCSKTPTHVKEKLGIDINACKLKSLISIYLTNLIILTCINAQLTTHTHTHTTNI